MITLLLLLLLLTVLMVGLLYAVIRFSHWQSRAVMLIIGSAIYLVAVFSLFSYYPLK